MKMSRTTAGREFQAAGAGPQTAKLRDP